jgi:hypothetical protein
MIPLRVKFVRLMNEQLVMGPRFFDKRRVAGRQAGD